MAIRDERKVTNNEAIISGKIPKSGGSSVGYHSLPNRKAFKETFLKMGRLSLKRKITIKARVEMDIKAKNKNRIFIMISFILTEINY